MLNTQEVKSFVEKNNIVPLIADWTDKNDEIGKLLETKFKTKQIPVLAIFPENSPEKPIVLLGGYTQGQLLEKLKAATASDKTEVAAAGL